MSWRLERRGVCAVGINGEVAFARDGVGGAESEGSRFTVDGEGGDGECAITGGIRRSVR